MVILGIDRETGRLLAPFYFAPAASSITLATSFGCDSITTWLEGSVVVMALICLAMLTSFSGVIM